MRGRDAHTRGRSRLLGSYAVGKQNRVVLGNMLRLWADHAATSLLDVHFLTLLDWVGVIGMFNGGRAAVKPVMSNEEGLIELLGGGVMAVVGLERL